MAPIPTYPSAAGFPVAYASNGQRITRDTTTADFKNLDAAGLKIWNESHAVDQTLGGAAYGSAEWKYQFVQNGKANSIGVPLPFPNMILRETYFPAYNPDATIQDVAPGEFPFDQCSQYAKDGAVAIADFRQRYVAYGDSDILPGTVITKAQGVTNIKVEYNQEAQAHGCTTVPFPDASGSTRIAAEPPPVYTAPPKPVNTLNGVPLTEDGQPVTGGPYPGDVNAPIPQDTADGIGSGPTNVFTGGGPIPNVGMPPRPLDGPQVNVSTTDALPGAGAAPVAKVGGWWIVALAVGALYVITRE